MLASTVVPPLFADNPASDKLLLFGEANLQTLPMMFKFEFPCKFISLANILKIIGIYAQLPCFLRQNSLVLLEMHLVVEGSTLLLCDTMSGFVARKC